MKKIVYGLLSLFMFISLLSATEGFADTMNYGVQAEIPENQIDKSKTYFDLLVKPGQKQNLTLTLTNTEDKEIQLLVEPNNAVTNKNGVIDYSKTDQKKDSTLKVPFKDLVTGNTTITLKPKEKKTVTFELTVPKESFEGMVLGGFYIHKVASEAEQKTQENVQIKNEYSYVIAVALRESLTDVPATMKLNEVKPNLENYHTAVTANLQDTMPTIINKLKIDASITKKGSKKVLHATEKENLTMAPNSNFDFLIDWNNDPLKAGIYTLHLTATSPQGEWTFTEDFEIKQTAASSLNKKAVELTPDNSWWLYLLAALLVILLLIILFLLKQLRSKKDISEKNPS